MAEKSFKFACQTRGQTEPKSRVKQEPVDWTKCFLCQEDKQEHLQDPRLYKGLSPGSGYATIAGNIHRFRAINSLPMKLNSSFFEDETVSLEHLLSSHTAKWHKSCNLKFNTTELKRAEKRSLDSSSGSGEDVEVVSKKLTRRSLPCNVPMKASVCFFCDNALPDEKHEKRESATRKIDTRVRECANVLQDTALLAKLSTGDLVALEAKYHAKCLVALYNKAGRTENGVEKSSESHRHESLCHAIALADIVSYIEDCRDDPSVAHVFPMPEIVNMYSARLKQLGIQNSSDIHSTKLKDKILANVPDLQAHKEGRVNLLVFNEDIGPALRKVCVKDDLDSNFIQTHNTAKLIRKDILNMTTNFSGSFSPDCQESAVPQSLLTLVNMLLYGSELNSNAYSQPALSLSQLIMFNYINRSKENAKSLHHSKSRETPLPAYLGMMVHCQTRKRDLVDKLFQLGLSVSYDRVLTISTCVANGLTEQYTEHGVVCPPALRKNLYTTAAVDNIDHNPSATTAKDSFHGTGISLFQIRSRNSPGDSHVVPAFDETMCQSQTVKPLPESYTIIPPAVLIDKEPAIPETNTELLQNTHGESGVKKEFDWLRHVQESVDDTYDGRLNISWSAFHADRETEKENTLSSLTALLPLFEEQSKSVAMIRHSLNMIKASVEKLNPGQTPVVAFDQPLYAIAKQIQWNWPNLYGEDKLVIMFGGLHIEMASFKVLGEWLEDSGWTHALIQADIASAGTADSFLKASHVTKTRRAHQITACSLYILLQAAYAEYIVSCSGGVILEFEGWCDKMSTDKPHFHFWYLTLLLQLDILTFIRSVREGNFSLYLSSLAKLIPWFFVMNHINYARWLPVHLRDMMLLPILSPSTEVKFRDGCFVVHKTRNKFSGLAIDQAHEQNNALVKSDGGAVGLTENPGALRRWMIAGPEMSRLSKDFEALYLCHTDITESHHEQTKGSQQSFH